MSSCSGKPANPQRTVTAPFGGPVILSLPVHLPACRRSLRCIRLCTRAVLNCIGPVVLFSLAANSLRCTVSHILFFPHTSSPAPPLSTETLSTCLVLPLCRASPFSASNPVLSFRPLKPLSTSQRQPPLDRDQFVGLFCILLVHFLKAVDGFFFIGLSFFILLAP